MRAAQTIKIYGLYLVLAGIGMVLMPDTVLGTVGIPPSAEIWPRVLGGVSIVLGYYYWCCGVAGAMAFFKASVIGRTAFFVLCVLLVAVAGAPAGLVALGATDLLSAFWTHLALRREAVPAAA